MKTLFLYIDTDLNKMFFEKEGDYSHLNDIFINGSDDQEKIDELSEIIAKEDFIELDKPTKDWDCFVYCGFIL